MPPFETRSRVARAAALLLLAFPLAAQPPAVDDRTKALKAILEQEGYATPPAELAALAMAPRHLNVSLANPSPDRTKYIKEQSEGAPTVAQMGRPHVYYAGLQVDPKANRSRLLGTRGGTGLQVLDVRTGTTTTLATPAGAQVSGAVWSPDGTRIAYLAHFDAATHAYVADLATGKSTAVSRWTGLPTARGWWRCSSPTPARRCRPPPRWHRGRRYASGWSRGRRPPSACTGRCWRSRGRRSSWRGT
jgi:dipeptidyl aminopeptidase/acylaminoacyl peptidase